ncbi:hypothetical protein ON064_10740 [Planococcus sp. A6]|uniref:hypothetical protein n=1 Tax=Planococcus sp. A6 TaxID=2992760 RepID=UPI00237B5360|nr:hypothetical protein [Planococcus sp. A6]MDE0583510.1 hypothetical protein [Planococcus sp. A6]
MSITTDAFRGHGLSRFVAGAPAGSSAHVAPSLCSVTAPAGVAVSISITNLFNI